MSSKENMNKSSGEFRISMKSDSQIREPKIKKKNGLPSNQILDKIWNDYFDAVDRHGVNAQQVESHRSTLVETYRPWVRSIAKDLSYHLHNITEDEIESNAISGLYDAISKYRRSFGNKFTSYARKRVKGSVYDAIRKEDHISRTTRMKAKKMADRRAAAEQHFGRKPHPAEFAAFLGLSEEQALKEELAAFSPIVNSFSFEMNEDQDSSVFDIFEDNSVHNPDEKVLRSEFLHKLMGRGFIPMERKIIYRYHFEEASMKEIADDFGLSESRVSQMHKEILERLRKKIEMNPTYFEGINGMLSSFQLVPSGLS